MEKEIENPNLPKRSCKKIASKPHSCFMHVLTLGFWNCNWILTTVCYRCMAADKVKMLVESIKFKFGTTRSS